MCTITTTSVLMPLSWLAGIAIFGSFCQLCASFLLNGYFSRSFFMHSFCNFLGQLFFLFPVISSFIISCIWELMSWQMTQPYKHTRLWIICWICTATPTLSWRTLVNTLSTSLTPSIILIMQHHTPCNFTSSATVITHLSQ